MEERYRLLCTFSAMQRDPKDRNHTWNETAQLQPAAAVLRARRVVSSIRLARRRSNYN